MDGAAVWRRRWDWIFFLNLSQTMKLHSKKRTCFESAQNSTISLYHPRNYRVSNFWNKTFTCFSQSNRAACPWFFKVSCWFQKRNNSINFQNKRPPLKLIQGDDPVAVDVYHVHDILPRSRIYLWQHVARIGDAEAESTSIHQEIIWRQSSC